MNLDSWITLAIMVPSYILVGIGLSPLFARLARNIVGYSPDKGDLGFYVIFWPTVLLFVVVTGSICHIVTFFGWIASRIVEVDDES